VRIVNDQGVEESEERDGCVIRDGIPVVMKDATLLDGWKLIS
jgi:hypothetical protein